MVFQYFVTIGKVKPGGLAITPLVVSKVIVWHTLGNLGRRRLVNRFFTVFRAEDS